MFDASEPMSFTAENAESAEENKDQTPATHRDDLVCWISWKPVVDPATRKLFTVFSLCARCILCGE
jgi:hypothetical protein